MFSFPQQVSDRLDELILEMREVLKSTTASWPGGRMVPHVNEEPRDIVCIGSGQSLAALAMRWAGLPLKCGVRLLFETAGVAVLGYFFAFFCKRDQGLTITIGSRMRT
jgi:probable phosphoglycerate mutase